MRDKLAAGPRASLAACCGLTSLADVHRAAAVLSEPAAAKNKCLGCHGEGKKLESDYDMRTRDGLIRGGDIGTAVVPGKADESPLYEMVLRDGEKKMPPQERNALDILEIDALARWINMGLPWAENTPPTIGIIP
jgi:hypothetical protein